MGRWGTAYSVARHRDWPLAERGAHRVRSHRFWFAGASIPSVSILSVSLVMTSTDLIILALLMEAPGHGYDLKKRLERLTAGTFALNDKLLYPALRRFAEDDLVTS